MTRLPRLGPVDSGSRRPGRLSDRRRFVGLRPWLESLENRLVLSTITWNAPTGGDWDTPGNWSPAQVPGSGDDAVINLSSAATVSLSSNLADTVHSLVTNANTTLKVENGSLSLGAGSSTLGGPVTVDQGAALNATAGASVVIAANQTLTDNGTLSFATGDTVTVAPSGCCSGAQLVVDGTLMATGTTFTNNGDDGATITVNPGGIITPGTSTFSLPLFVPYNDVASLAAGNNVSFHQIEIDSGTLPSGSELDLNAIGTNPTNLSYIFPGAFTVAAGATVKVGTTVPVQVSGGQTLTDNGTLSFATGDMLTLATSGCCSSAQLVVDGTLMATGTTFADNGSASAAITVNPDGIITPATSTFSLPLFVPYNDVASLAAGNNVSFHQIEIDSGTLPSGSELDLNAIGTNPTNLSYIFPGAFTVAAGATLKVGTTVPVQVSEGQTLTDHGTLSFATGDMVTLVPGGCCDPSAQLVVDGTLAASGTTFAEGTGTGANITVDPGGIITPVSSTFNLPLFVPYNDVASLAAGNNVSFDQIEIDSGTLPSGQELDLDLIGTNTANLSYIFPGAFTVASGATLNVGTTVPVQVSADETLTDNGTLSFATGDMVTLVPDGGDSAQLVVAGTLTATGTTFTNNGDDGATITVNPGGVITPSTSTFSLPLFVPYNDVASLAAGNNVSFHQVEIDSGTLPSGNELDLNLIGTNTSNLVYIFPGAFTVAAGATVNVGATVPVQISGGQTLTDNGTLSFATGDMLTLATSGCCSSAQLVVAGTLMATGTTFTNNGDDGATITVNPGGIITPGTSTFSLPLFVPYNDVASLAAGSNVSFDQIEIDSGTLPSGDELDLDLIGTNPANPQLYLRRRPSTVGRRCHAECGDHRSRPGVSG